MTRTPRIVTLLVALAAVWAQTPATHAGPGAPSAPRLAISDATLTEGDSGTTRAVFEVTLSEAARAKVHYTTVDRTATAGSDYEPAEGTLTFRDGRTVRRIVVTVLGDGIQELDERFRVVLSNATGAAIRDHGALGTITDDDGSGSGTLPSLSIGDATVTEGNGGTTPAVFAVMLSAASAGTVTVDFATAAGAATAAVDFQPATGTLTFSPGETARSVTVEVVGDTIGETDESFLVVLSAASGATIAEGTGFGTITDDDGSGGGTLPSLSIGDASVTEGSSGTTPATFVVTLSAASAATATVDFATAAGSATAAVDFHPATGTLTFGPGETAKSVTVQVNGDTTVETDETFLVVLSNASGATIAQGTGLGTITNDDTLPSVAIAAATVTEGNTGTTSAVFNLTLSAPSVSTVTVDYATVDGSAVAPGDYTAGSGTVTFSPGQTSRQATIQVQGDTLVETTETFSVALANATNATLTGSGSALGTITNDDTLPSVSIAAATVTEGNVGTTAAVFNLTLSAPSLSTVTVDHATVDGSAVAPGDYTAATGTVTFSPGQISKQVTIQVQGDTLVETTEIFSVTLANPTNATVAGSGSAIGTITNDDTLPSISIAAATVTEGNAGTTAAVFNLTLSAPSASTVTVDYATVDGSAVAPGDYTAATGTVAFSPGQTSRQVTVQVQGDTSIETTEIFTVNLSNPTNATLTGSGSAIGTITNDDTLPSISIAALTIAEGNTGNTAFVFTLTLSAPSASTVTVDYATVDGSAVAPADYTAASGTVTFNPGQTSKQVVVQVKGETLNETNETFSVNLANPTNATLAGSGFATGTITNDDAVPSLSINNVAALEGNAGLTNFVFTVTLSAASGQTVTVDFATANGTAVTPGDYVANSGTVTFSPGTTTQTITIQVVGDAVLEANETFTVNLSNAINASISGTGIGTGTITNDD